MKSKEKIVTFKASSEYMELLERLCAVLKLDRSKTIRIALDEAVEKYVSKSICGDIIVMDTKTYHATLMSFFDRINRLNELEKEVERLESLLETYDPKQAESWKHQKRLKEIERTQGRGA
ncbi:MAG: ribbon-helix-helix protein, CopG family, partial [Desulfobacterales bacterium]